MSHFTRIETQIKDQQALAAALESLKLRHALDAVVRGYRGQTTRAELVAQPGGDYDIGFVRESADTAFAIVADWWGVEQHSPWRQADFIKTVTQRYAYHKVLHEVQRQGFQVVNETATPEQGIKLTVRRWQ
jgi:hypothetical protein